MGAAILIDLFGGEVYKNSAKGYNEQNFNCPNTKLNRQ